MSEIEKIKRYIALTGIKVHGQDRYAMNMREVRELMRSGEERPFDAIDLAFEYGKAKGYRAAKAEVRKGGAT